MPQCWAGFHFNCEVKPVTVVAGITRGDKTMGGVVLVMGQ